MTRSQRARLLAAPELLAVDLVQAALASLLTALLLAHPSLDEPPFHRAPPCLRRARVLAHLARRFGKELRAYGRAVDDSLTDAPSTEQLPF